MGKICVVSPSISMGGIERALVVLANHFVSKGHDISFISCIPRPHFYQLDGKVNIREPDLSYYGGFINKLIFYPRIVFFIRRNIQKIRPDAVLSFGDWFNPVVLLALFGLKFPVFISDRTSPDYKFKFPVTFLKKKLYPRSAGFIAQTGLAAEYNRTEFRNRLNIRTVPNALRR